MMMVKKKDCSIFIPLRTFLIPDSTITPGCLFFHAFRWCSSYRHQYSGCDSIGCKWLLSFKQRRVSLCNRNPLPALLDIVDLDGPDYAGPFTVELQKDHRVNWAVAINSTSKTSPTTSTDKMTLLAFAITNKLQVKPSIPEAIILQHFQATLQL